MNEKVIQYVIDEELVNKISEIHAILHQSGLGKASLSDKYLKADEMRNEFGISPRTEWNWLKRKLLHPIKIAGKRYYRKSELEDMLSGNQEENL